MLSPMMACEEAYLLGSAIRGDRSRKRCWCSARCPRAGQDEIFRHSITGQQTFTIKAEKVPNAAGIRRVISMLGGPNTTYDQFVHSPAENLKAGWIVGGYLSNWITGDLPETLKRGFRIVQDMLPTSTQRIRGRGATVGGLGGKGRMLGKFRREDSAVYRRRSPPEGVTRDGEYYLSLLGRGGLYNAAAIRNEMGGPVCVGIIAGREHFAAGDGIR